MVLPELSHKAEQQIGVNAAVCHYPFLKSFISVTCTGSLFRVLLSSKRNSVRVWTVLKVRGHFQIWANLSFKLIPSFTVYHRTIESLELERTFKDHLVQLPCNEQGHPQLDQVVRGLIQPCLESLLGWSINHITGQPLSVPYHPRCKMLLSNIQPKLTLFKLETISPCSITTDPTKESVPFFSVASLYILKGCYQITSVPSLLQAEEHQLFQPVLVGEVFHSVDHFCGPTLHVLQQVCVSPVQSTLHLDAVLQVRPHQHREERQDHLPWPTGHTSFDAAQHTVGFLGYKGTLLAHVQFPIPQYPPKSFLGGLYSILSTPSLYWQWGLPWPRCKIRFTSNPFLHKKTACVAGYRD